MKLVLVLALACACSHSEIKVRSSRVDGAAPVETVMVFTDISEPPFAGAMNQGFEPRMRSSLAACQVRSEFRRIVHDGGDFMASSLAQMEAMHTNAAVIFKPAGGKVITYEHERSHEVAARSYNVDVEVVLFDRRVNRVTWQAIVNFDGYVNGINTVKDGEAFASAIASRLRRDGMMLGCAAN